MQPNNSLEEPTCPACGGGIHKSAAFWAVDNDKDLKCPYPNCGTRFKVVVERIFSTYRVEEGVKGNG
jgi:hypothetical protein